MKKFEQRKARELRKINSRINKKKIWKKVKPYLFSIIILLTLVFITEYIDKKLDERLDKISMIDVAYADEIIPEKEKIVIEQKVIDQVEKTVVAEISAYTSSVDETDDTPFITASGQRTRKGIIACPSKYDFGQIVEIKGKDYECQDRMNSRYRDKEVFDIWHETKAEAFQWGRRTLTVKIK